MSEEKSLADDISIKDFIQAISEDLMESRTQRLASGLPPVFEVAALDIDLSVKATRSSKKNGGVDLKVLRGDLESITGSESVQKISLHLTATRMTADEKETEVFDASSPLRPSRKIGV
jgi:hypothetical protein